MECQIAYGAKVRKFATLEDAKRAAQAIFAATGIVVGIELADNGRRDPRQGDGMD